MNSKRPTLLAVLDGLGLNPNQKSNAFALAKTPVLDRLLRECPHTTLTTHGTRVGLPEGYMGNSEVGHLNIGAGREVLQWLYRIDLALSENFLEESEAYRGFYRRVSRTSTVHLIGLFSEGGVHSHSSHFYKLAQHLIQDGYENIAIHVLTDGRDTAPRIILEDLKRLGSFVAKNPACSISTVSGRFYTMDRDRRWERTEQAFKAIALSEGHQADSVAQWIEKSYTNEITDEFIEPCVVSPQPIGEGDGIIFWNFRADRMRQIVETLSATRFEYFEREWVPPARENILCFTEYKPDFALPFLFAPVPVHNHIGEVVSNLGLKQLRTAESEKYPHVTYFFNGGLEEPLKGEARSLVPSPRDVKTYDLKPEMSAYAVKNVVVKGIKSGKYDFIVVNFANPDMVGHTGVLDPTITAVETVDTCLGEILEALDEADGQALFIADHGNCEQMIDYETGEPHTAHTTFPVPAILYGFDSGAQLREGGALCDVAPTLLQMMGINPPEEMTGESLIP